MDPFTVNEPWEIVLLVWSSAFSVSRRLFVGLLQLLGGLIFGKAAVRLWMLLEVSVAASV